MSSITIWQTRYPMHDTPVLLLKNMASQPPSTRMMFFVEGARVPTVTQETGASEISSPRIIGATRQQQHHKTSIASPIKLSSLSEQDFSRKIPKETNGSRYLALKTSTERSAMHFEMLETTTTRLWWGLDMIRATLRQPLLKTVIYLLISLMTKTPWNLNSSKNMTILGWHQITLLFQRRSMRSFLRRRTFFLAENDSVTNTQETSATV